MSSIGSSCFATVEASTLPLCMAPSSGTTIPMGKMTLEDGNALVIVNLQRDFLPGGSCAVAGGDTIVPIVNRYLAAWSTHRLPIVLSRCWHPPDHCSFHDRGGRWPRHCVAGTDGAEFAAALQIPPDSVVIAKGTEADREACSAFDGTDLHDRLRLMGTTQVFVGGLATDYGVLDTVRDALERGYTTVVLQDAIRAASLEADDGRKAEESMAALGARLVSLEALGL
jgi:nicotinamidase/pyrazinamidase